MIPNIKFQNAIPSAIRTLLILLVAVFVQRAQASHYTFGGEMWATSIGNNQYVLINKIYKHCSSTSSYDSVYIDAYAGNSASCGMVKFKAGRASIRYIGTKCSTATDCSKGVPLNEIIYKCTVDLSSTAFAKLTTGTTCKTITFCAWGYWMYNSTACKDRDAFFTTTLYLNNLANCSKSTNIAPVTLFDPVRNFQVDRTAYFAQGLVDTAERDMLRYQLEPTWISYPYENKSCANTPNSDYLHPFTPTCVGSTLCAANTKSSPVRGTYFDSLDGSLMFAPSIPDQIGVIGTRVYEYRINKNGVYTLIAVHSREVGGFVINPNGANETPRVITPNPIIKICIGKSVSQKFTDFDDIVAPSQSVVDSLVYIIPPTYRGASIKAYRSAKNKLAFEFNWTPTNDDTLASGYTFPIKVIDQNCNPPMASTCNLTVKVFPTPTGTPQAVYKGCNKLNLYVKNFKGGRALKVSWQVLDSSGKTMGTSNKLADSVQLNGTGKYKILALMSNEGGCFKYWDSTIQIIDTVINFALGGKSPIVDTLNCPKSALYLEPKNVSARKGTITYQWYGLPNNMAFTGTLPRNLDLGGLTKIGNTKGITFNTQTDTSAVLVITDAKGCTEAQQINISQVFSDPVNWIKTPLTPICASDPPLKLIDPTTKDLLDGGANTGIRCLNGKYLDSLGPNYYKLRAPAAINGVDKITLTLVAMYDTLGCISRDTNTIDVMYRPQFELANSVNICSGDSAYFPEDALVKKAKNALPYEWKLIGMPSKSIAQLMTLTVGGRTGTHLVTHLDSIAVGTYKLQACASDSTLGCRACDTTSIISKPQVRVRYTGDTLFCPNDIPTRLRDHLSISSGESSDTLYTVQLMSFNGSTNLSNVQKKVLDESSSVFTPRGIVGKALVQVASSKYCYADANLLLRIQDTIAIDYSVSPDTVVRLPRTSFTFTANTTSTKVWWYFGTGNNADTSTLNPITWSFDNKVANYRVSARSFNSNGCYGEFTRTIGVWDVSGLDRFLTEAKISGNLLLISDAWMFEELTLFDVQGKCVLRTQENIGVTPQALSKGVYTYKLKAYNHAGAIEKSGKWLNFGE